MTLCVVEPMEMKYKYKDKGVTSCSQSLVERIIFFQCGIKL